MSSGSALRSLRWSCLSLVALVALAACGGNLPGNSLADGALGSPDAPVVTNVRTQADGAGSPPDGDPDASSDVAAADAPVEAGADCVVTASASTVGTAVFTGTTAGASHRARRSSCPQAGPEVLVAWTAPADGLYRIDSNNSRFDTVLSVARTCGGEELVCNDDAVGIRSSLTLRATAGETLYLTIDGAIAAAAGQYIVDITMVTASQCDMPGYACEGGFLGWERGYVHPVGGACASPFAESSVQLYDTADLQTGTFGCACQCGDPRGGACSAALHCTSGGTCSTANTQTIGTSCGAPLNFVRDASYACTLEMPVPAGPGRCDSTVREQAHERPTWAPRAGFCRAPSAATACAPWTGTTCQPRVPEGQQRCLLQRGTHSCPTPYTQRTLYAGGLTQDTRSCDRGTCACTVPPVTACMCDPARGCHANFYTSDLCSDGARVAGASVNFCSTFRYLGIRDARPSLSGATPVLGACSVTGAPVSNGAVRPVPENVVTVCCKPIE